MHRRLVFWLSFLPLLWLSSACNDFKAWYAKEFKQDELSSGIARLSTQHFLMVSSEMVQRFKDPTLPFEVVADDKDHGKGKIIRTIENLHIDYADEKEVYQDCIGNRALWQGSVHVVKAVQTMYGRLTNNPKNPVVPDHDGIKMMIQVNPANVAIRFTEKNAHLRLKSGEISFEVFPRLAQAQLGALKGLRIIPTSNTRFENVVMRNVSGMLYSEKVDLPFIISDSQMHIQVGSGESGEENKMTGSITAFGHTRSIPTDSDALNPDYNAKRFVESYSCVEGLNGIVEYNNVALEEKLGPGMAALTTMALSKIAAKIADDHQCGMASPEFLRTTKLTGELHKNGAEAMAFLQQDCPITFKNFRTDPDCFGIAHIINGEVTAREMKKLTKGLLFFPEHEFLAMIDQYELALKSGDIATAKKNRPEPIIPTTRQPAVIEFVADLSGLTIQEDCVAFGTVDHPEHCSKRNNNEPPLIFALTSGNIHASLKPMMGKNINPEDERYLMCTRTIPVAETEFSLNQVTASIKRSGNEFSLKAQGAYRAISGQIDHRENELSGHLNIGRIPVAFSAHGHNFLPLKPDYERKKYQDSFQSCQENILVIPASDEDCSLKDLGL